MGNIISSSSPRRIPHYNLHNLPWSGDLHNHNSTVYFFCDYLEKQKSIQIVKFSTLQILQISSSWFFCRSPLSNSRTPITAGIFIPLFYHTFIPQYNDILRSQQQTSLVDSPLRKRFTQRYITAPLPLWEHQSSDKFPNPSCPFIPYRLLTWPTGYPSTYCNLKIITKMFLPIVTWQNNNQTVLCPAKFPSVHVVPGFYQIYTESHYFSWVRNLIRVTYIPLPLVL